MPGELDDSAPRWRELLSGGNAARTGVIGGGMAMHALNTFIVTTIMPTVVADLGGLGYLAWSTTLYVAASLLGGACCSRVLARVGPRRAYRAALAVFALGALLCALAPTMPALLAARFVQGLGAGTLSALSFSMVRLLFARRLWPRAIAIASTVWGVATLLGPALGGLFAEAGVWRPAFWMVLAATPCFWLLVERCLAGAAVQASQAATPLPVGRLGLLLASVGAVCAASVAPAAASNALGVAVAVGVFAVFVARERGAGGRLLPRGACDPRTPMGAVVATQLLLLAGVAVEVFVPYLLQTLHGMSPLHAGYLCAAMSAGWSTGSIGGAGAGERASRAMMTAGPAIEAAALAWLFVLMPAADASIVAIGVALFALGFGIGFGWPHLCARVYRFAAEAERDLASASLTVTVMIGNAFGAAFGGLATNMAGLGDPGGVAGAAAAAAWLFGLAALAPAAALWTVARVRRFSRTEVSA